MLIGAVYSYHHARSAAQKYEASAQLLFGSNQTVPSVLGIPSSSSGSSNATPGATNASLAGLPIISQNTAAALGKKLPPGGVNVSTQALGTTNLVEVTAASLTPKGAALVANTYAYQFVYYTQQQQHQQLEQAITAIRRELGRTRPAAGPLRR